jgi:Sec-independent protein translocase protein TatA
MQERLDPTELIFILLLAILLFGNKLGGKSWQEMENELAQAIQRFRQSDPQAQMDSATVRDLTVLGIVCVILALELSWLATRA